MTLRSWIVLLLWQLAALIYIFPGGAHAETCMLASYYSSHMVLQQQPHSAVIWGYADIKATIEVKVRDKMYKTSVEAEVPSRVGVWKVKLDPMLAGGPYDIVVFCEAFTVVNSVILEDVMFGDVWVCSGQSNMAFAVDQSFNGSKELNESVNYPNIRLLAVKQVLSETPYDDLHGLYEPWSKPSPETLGSKAQIFNYFSALCWFFGRDLYDSMQYPIGLISTNWGGTPIEDWSSPDVLKKCSATHRPLPESDDRLTGTIRGPHVASGLWNSMIHPLLNFTIKGAIWYQGEANTVDPDPYKCLFNAMITDWREKWYEGTLNSTDIKFPFGFMQLCTSNVPSSEIIGPYTTLRWHQTYDYGYVPNDVMQNVFMAVGIDLPDLTSPYGPIHPRDKEDMGVRLSLAGRAVAYRQNIPYAGPFPTSFTVNTTTLALDIEYDKGQANIKLVGQTGFEICCGGSPPCKYYDTWVPAKITGQPTPSSISLSYYCYHRRATAVRYLWRDMPCTFKNCPVYRVENELPGPPFMLNL
ncbi:sialate O-acetylesterase-like [Patiria miniata]|uniref:Sialate O-acetylesterase domain-containing protein n=1 Tax=Patiria miniata TaxID=46514 RepID=A0A914B1D6_PATMI|nr:sialate O-acetylesterase-like [Patiria miniata]XP_038069723.1 sialate O-acetylesterase-like [Patiria miniata]